MAPPFVRAFNFATDDSACLHVVCTTMDSSVSHEPARTIGSYLWYKAYAYLTPSTCFVLDDGTGHAVGYIIGTPDTAAFSASWKSKFAPVIDPKIVPPPGVQTDDPAMETDHVKGLRKAVYEGECSVLQGAVGILNEYPAHLHINLLPEFTGQGLGAKLMERFLEAIQGLGAGGVHLGMVRTNHGARRFYERLGFQLCQEILDGGASGELGRQDSSVWLVRKLVGQ